jgi:hypothetical protein
MHWRQQEMLFEQREALKEQTSGTKKRKKDRDDDDERLSRKNPRRKFGNDAVIKMAPPVTPGRKPSFKREGVHSKKEGMHSKKEGKHLKKKAESHCEAYAEAYVRGVEQALSEKRRKGLLPEGEPGPRPFKRRDLRLQRQGQSVKPTTRAKAPKR